MLYWIFGLTFIAGMSGNQDDFPSFDKNYNVTWGHRNFKSSWHGRDVQLTLDRDSGILSLSSISSFPSYLLLSGVHSQNKHIHMCMYITFRIIKLFDLTVKQFDGHCDLHHSGTKMGQRKGVGTRHPCSPFLISL